MSRRMNDSSAIFLSFVCISTLLLLPETFVQHCIYYVVTERIYARVNLHNQVISI